MASNTRRALWTLVVLTIVGAPLVFLAMAELVQPPSGRDRVWISTLSTTELQNAADHLDQLPLPKRREVLSRLPASKQSAYWRSKLTAFLKTNPTLAAAQVNAVNAAFNLASPAFFEKRTPFGQSERRVFEELNRTLGREAYSDLTGTAGPPRGLQRVLGRAAIWMRSNLVVSARAPHCDCVQEAIFPCGWTSLDCQYPPNPPCAPLDECWIPWQYVYCYGNCGAPEN